MNLLALIQVHAPYRPLNGQGLHLILKHRVILLIRTLKKTACSWQVFHCMVGSSLACKCYTTLEKPARNKHSSFWGPIMSYEEKVCEYGPVPYMSFHQ